MPVPTVRTLSISDKVISTLHSTQLNEIVGKIDFVIACGDLPYYYQEFIARRLRVPLYFVRGNHDPLIEYSARGDRKAPQGATNLHARVVHENGIIFAGVEGSVRYNDGNFQYTQSEMWGHVLRLVPKLFLNRLRHGRYLDVFVTHASPSGIHDKPDRTHQGIQAFNWLLKTFKPKFHFHGHNHVYRNDTITETQVGETLVINTYGYKLRELTF